MSKKLQLLRIAEIEHVSKDGKILWRKTNLPNMFHKSGQEFVLRSLFLTGSNQASIPDKYYFGLDNRLSLTEDDTMGTVANSGDEPTFNGYARQSVTSDGDFDIAFTSGVYEAESPILTFFALGGSWGPVRNLFLTDKSDNSGYLLASVELDQPTTLNDGELINMRMVLNLFNI